MSALMENAASDSPSQDSASPRESFLKKKQAELAQESDSRETGSPEQFNSESAEDVPSQKIRSQHEADEYEEQEEYAEAEESESESDLYEDEAPEEEAPEAEGEVDWEKRFKDTQADYTRLSQERAKEREESAQSIEQNIRLRHSLEENSQVVERHGEFLTNLLNQQVHELERQSLRQDLSVEDKAKLNEQYRLATNSRDMMQNQLDQITAQGRQAIEDARQKEAEVSKQVLKRTIPQLGGDREGYNAHFMTLRQHAIENVGYTAEEFDQITDHRLIRLIHNNWDAQQALAKVQEVKRKGKKRQPKRGAKPQERNAQGRFKSAVKDFRQGKIPAREMLAQKLRNEHGGR